MNSAVLAEKTRLAAPLGELEARVVAEFPKVEGWLRAQFWRTPPPFYCSVDLRNDGRKIAPIDTNLFPGGFNNLPRESHPVAMEAFRRLLADLCPNAKSVLLVPENHTRNLAYWDNVAVLKYLLESAGIAVRIGGLEENGQARITEGGGGMQIESVSRVGDELHIGDFRPCAILLNNDLSAGVPKMLAGLSQPTMPAVAAGWTTRRKSGHFAEYNKVADEFADELKIDPWFIRPQFAVCREVDFRRSQGLECVVKAADKVLEGIRAKHREYGIEDTPFVVVKADAGTYGMGVMTAKSADDLRSLNRRQRNKMSVIKEGLAVRDILIQEGIRAADSAAGATAEPVAYMLGGTVIGGFYRVNENRASDENLNSGGMSFMPLPFETACCPPSPFALGGGGGKSIDNGDAISRAADRLYVYGVIARLAALAAAREFFVDEMQTN